MSRKTEPVAGTAGVPALPLPRATVEHGPKESIYYLDGVKVRKSPRRDYAGAILRRETRGGVDGPWKVIGFRKTFLAAFNEAHSSGVGFAERRAAILALSPAQRLARWGSEIYDYVATFAAIAVEGAEGGQ